ncbi:FAS1-like dehydratase domain-containing protein [Pseudonocardia pini]|uniref:FAS1-like dehydratase domain-containing protein n=1 Tax=Pseudonocardia pini TaxID=2758030 RepID=UPI0015F08D18|nr:MaoC family dehydratase N-terminal domain-containing protein [Pseudonocardia pini]
MTGDATVRAAPVSVGDAIPPLVVTPGEVQLFRFSAATWNSHRIHYDEGYARSEGYPGVLVQSHLHGSLLSQTVLNWAGPHGRLRRFRWQNRAIAVPGDTLTCTGTVTAVGVEGEALVVEIELEGRKQDGTLCAPGAATVELPSAGRFR